LMQTLYVVANNAYLNVHFDSSVVKQYRLIGYDNPIVNGINLEKVLEGGEIGTGHTATAIFEIEMTPGFIEKKSSVCNVELGYQFSDTGAVQMQKYDCNYNYLPFDKLDSTYLFLASVAEFGMLLRNSKHVQEGNWEDLQMQLEKSARPNDFWQTELLEIVKQASNIYQTGKKKRRFLFKKKSSLP
jgi:Ca-activated chloride channel family protein